MTTNRTLTDRFCRRYFYGFTHHHHDIEEQIYLPWLAVRASDALLMCLLELPLTCLRRDPLTCL